MTPLSPLVDARGANVHTVAAALAAREDDVTRIARERARVSLARVVVVVSRDVAKVDVEKWISFASSPHRARDEREDETGLGR